MTTGTLGAVAYRLAHLLTTGEGGLGDPGRTRLDFDAPVEPRLLEPKPVPPEVWAVDGGQALVVDARCLQVVATRASRVCFRSGACVMEEEGTLRAHVLGGKESRAVLEEMDLHLPPDTVVDANLIRDRWEWDAVQRCIADAVPGALVMVDGDLEPDWRIAQGHVAGLVDDARRKGVKLAGVTKHSSLSRGGAPLLGQLEMEAGRILGDSARWWVPVARTRAGEDRDLALRVVAARLDPMARFCFRVDVPMGDDVEAGLGVMAAVSDDAAFPGYPYPLAVADRLAACPPWLRDELRALLDEYLAIAGVGYEVRERAFADRHRMMERA